MAIAVVLSYPAGNQVQGWVDEFPSECPVCHRGMEPILIAARILAPTSFPYGKLDLGFQCTARGCYSVIIGRYRGNSNAASPNTPFVLESTAPKHAQPTKFSDEISHLSPTFVTVYNQAMSAEDVGLDQLVGMGLRKALEFLVKDFAMRGVEDEEAKAKIRKMNLGDCIKEHIKDADLKRMAERATWLANDETHYERLWTDKDIKDVKNLVRLTIHAVDDAILMEGYVDEMPEGKKR